MDVQPSDNPASTGQVLDRLAITIESRLPAHGGDANASYVARLLQRGPDAFLKKVGEEATEVVMASKDLDVALASGAGVDDRRAKLVGEVADLWFHCMVALAHYGLRPSDVTDELARREGTSGIEEKALRKAIAREGI
jgi:phosphoribosyl-ATP pyrophosphohydrolase